MVGKEEPQLNTKSGQVLDYKKEKMLSFPGHYHQAWLHSDWRTSYPHE